jgi:hypothetical protein
MFDAELPQDEQIRIPSRDSPKPMHGLSLSTLKPFIFPPRPRCERQINVAQNLNTLRSIVPSVVVHPAPHHWIDKLGQILQALIVPGGGQPPFANGVPDRFGCFGADRRQETHKELPIAILCPSRLEGVAQEVERYVFVFPTPIGILAINDPGLHRMKFQAAFLKPISDRLQHFLGLPLTPAMDESIVRVAFEWDTWEIPLHPHIKRIMQEEIGEQRTHHSPYTKETFDPGSEYGAR